MVWAGVSLGYHTSEHISRWSSVMAVWYQDEVLDHTMRFHAAATGPDFV